MIPGNNEPSICLAILIQGQGLRSKDLKTWRPKGSLNREMKVSSLRARR